MRLWLKKSNEVLWIDIIKESEHEDKKTSVHEEARNKTERVLFELESEWVNLKFVHQHIESNF